MGGSDGVVEYKTEMADPDSMEFKKVAEAVENQVREKTSCKTYRNRRFVLICLINLKVLNYKDK